MPAFGNFLVGLCDTARASKAERFFLFSENIDRKELKGAGHGQQSNCCDYECSF
jgi:hypothetical protein